MTAYTRKDTIDPLCDASHTEPLSALEKFERRKMPQQKPHRSRQDYETPSDFFEAVHRVWHPIVFDLAASAVNRKARNWFTPNTPLWPGKEMGALVQAWHAIEPGWLWLNPPYSNIAPWASKCLEESKLGAEILLLVPASVGSNWFQNYVLDRAAVYFLRPRLSFDGKHLYPKDLMLCVYSHREQPGCYGWKWK